MILIAKLAVTLLVLLGVVFITVGLLLKIGLEHDLQERLEKGLLDEPKRRE